ncbi:MAG TPA: hypothetical protein VMU59_11030 [Caulobacteraceae bacterium]|nr:hypothetical protein [Caulobacteraceae bacterium]
MTLRHPHALVRPLVLAAAVLVLVHAPAAQAEDKKPKPSYMPFSGLAASVARGNGGYGVMSVDAGLDIPDPKLRDVAAEDMPRLYDAYGQVMRTFGASLLPGRVPDVDYLGRQLQAVTDQVLGRPGARVLLGGVMVD